MRILLLSLFLSAGLIAQEPARFTDPGRAEKVKATADAVAGVFKEYMQRRHMPGFAYGVVLDGELVYSGGFGKANLEKNIAADARTMFRIASMSKSFTALSILQLRDAGKLGLDDPVYRYVPEMKGVEPLFEDAPTITIRHLLTHGAGFPEDNPWGDRQLADTDEELIQLVLEGISFSNVPGVAYEYSNLGFALLGQIVQNVSGMSIEEYAKKNIFDPLGMHATVYEFDDAPKERLALGYNWIDEEYVNIPLVHHGSYGAMGGLITSVEDFAKYMSLHLSAWPPRNGDESSVLNRSSLREMQHPWRVASIMNYRYPDGRRLPAARAYAYGLSWMKDADGRVYVGHSGGLPGFGSNWTIMPDYGLGIVSCDNRTYGGNSTINLAVLDSIVALAGLQARELPVSEILKKRMKQLAALFPDWDGAESSGLFAENFFMDHRLKDVVKRTKELYEEAGGILGVGDMKPLNQLRGTFTLTGEKKDIQVFFTLTPEKDTKIQQVRMRAVDKQ